MVQISEVGFLGIRGLWLASLSLKVMGFRVSAMKIIGELNLLGHNGQMGFLPTHQTWDRNSSSWFYLVPSKKDQLGAGAENPGPKVFPDRARLFTLSILNVFYEASD